MNKHPEEIDIWDSGLWIVFLMLGCWLLGCLGTFIFGVLG